MFSSIDEVIEAGKNEGIEADIVKDGLIHVATNNAQLRRLPHHLEELRTQGWDEDDLFVLSREELDERVKVAAALGAFWTPHCARVHPAKFTVGLARAVERLGVTIYEDTPATSITARVVKTSRGTPPNTSCPRWRVTPTALPATGASCSQ
jgi:glycine/D-amino acid oxidase-like deaminating enzyme